MDYLSEPKETTSVTDDKGDIIMEGLLVDTLFKLRLSQSDDIKAKYVAKAMTAMEPILARDDGSSQLR